MATEVAKVYGEALWSLAADEGLEERFLTELRQLGITAQQNPGYLAMLASPALPAEARKQYVTDAWTGNLHSDLVHFLCVLIDHGRVLSLSAIIEEYEALYRESRHISVAQVTSATPLSDAQRESLRLRLEKKSGGRVELVCRTDPALLGGLRVEMGGYRYEGTARARLDELRRRLTETVL